MKKAVLASTFQIQYDSLLLNLKRNNFKLTKNMREWAVYEFPENFHASLIPINIPKIQAPRAMLKEMPETPVQGFMAQAREHWMVLTLGKHRKMIQAEQFFERMIDNFGVKSMRRSEMLYFLSRVTFRKIPGFVSFTDFVQLFANFGEKNLFFPKIVLLFKAVAVGIDHEIVFESVSAPPPRVLAPTVHFFNGSSYGFLVSFPNGRTLHVRNDVDLPFFSEYLVDSEGRRYSNWQTVLSS